MIELKQLFNQNAPSWSAYCNAYTEKLKLKVVFICFIFDPRTKWSSAKHSFACFTHSERSSAKHWDSLDPHIVKEISATGHYRRRRGHPIMKVMIISSIFNSNGEYIDTIHQIYWLNSIDVSLFVDCWVCHQTQIQKQSDGRDEQACLILIPSSSIRGIPAYIHFS